MHRAFVQCWELLRAVELCPSPDKLVILVCFPLCLLWPIHLGKDRYPCNLIIAARKVCLIVVVLRARSFCGSSFSRLLIPSSVLKLWPRLPCRRPFSACTCTPGSYRDNLGRSSPSEALACGIPMCIGPRSILPRAYTTGATLTHGWRMPSCTTSTYSIPLGARRLGRPP